MKNYLIAGLCAISLSFSLPLFSQCLWRETVINFDKEEENKKNFLGVISYKDSEYTDLVFIKKKPKDEVVYETIRLDKELYTVEKFEEADKDFGKDHFKGISYVTTIPTVAPVALGFNVVLESYEFRFHWNWATGDYSSASPIKKKKTKVKIPSSAGKGKIGVQYLTHTIDVDKQELLLVGNSTIPKEERDNPRYKTLIHRYNSNLDLISSSSFELDHPYTVLFSGADYIDGKKFLMVLAPVSATKSSAIVPNPDQYKLVIINEKGELERIIDFSTLCHRWKINGISVIEDEIIIYGIGEELVDKLGAADQKRRKSYTDGWATFVEPAAYIQIITLKK